MCSVHVRVRASTFSVTAQLTIQLKPDDEEYTIDTS